MTRALHRLFRFSCPVPRVPGSLIVRIHSPQRSNTARSVAAAKLERAIRKLPVEQRVSAHERLIATIHDKAHAQGLDPSSRDEIERRVRGIDDGPAKSFDAFRALDKL